MKTYVLIWNPWVNDVRLSRQKLLDTLDNISSVANWRATTGAVLIASDKDEDTLTVELHKKMPDLEFIISAVNIETSQGYTNQRTWDFIRYPRKV